MKKFNYYGQEITVPDYAKYIATDENGEMWWYSSCPRLELASWRGGLNCGPVGNNPNVKNWRRSLKQC